MFVLFLLCILMKKKNMTEEREIIPGLLDDVAMECLLRVPHQSFPNIRLVCRRWKAEIESPTFHLHRRSAGFARSLLVFVQYSPYSYSFTILDPAASKWYTLPAITMLRNSFYPLCKLVSAGQEMVVLGGERGDDRFICSNAVYIYSFINGTWRCGRPMPGPERQSFACAGDGGGWVFVAGGTASGRSTMMRSAFVYDVARDECTSLPEMTRGRHCCSVKFADGKFQVVGRFDWPLSEYEQSGEDFDVGQWRWRSVEDAAACFGSKYGTRVIGGEGCGMLREQAWAPYLCEGRMLAIGSPVWMAVGKTLPKDVGSMAHLMAWEESLMVAGKELLCDPLVLYVLDVARRGEGAGAEWRRLEVPPEYSDCFFQAGGCTIIL